MEPLLGIGAKQMIDWESDWQARFTGYKLTKTKIYIVQDDCDECAGAPEALFLERWMALDYVTRTRLNDWRVAENHTASEFVKEIDVIGVEALKAEFPGQFYLNRVITEPVKQTGPIMVSGAIAQIDLSKTQ